MYTPCATLSFKQLEQTRGKQLYWVKSNVFMASSLHVWEWCLFQWQNWKVSYKHRSDRSHRLNNSRGMSDVYNVIAKSFYREKPEINLELTLSKKRTELIPTSNSEIEGTQKSQAAEVRLPGADRISVLVSWSLLTALYSTLSVSNKSLHRHEILVLWFSSSFSWSTFSTHLNSWGTFSTHLS